MRRESALCVDPADAAGERTPSAAVAPGLSPVWIAGVAGVAGIMGRLGGMLLLLLLGMTCAAIGLRPFGLVWRGCLEAGGYVCAAAVGLCLPMAQFAGSHITGGFWADRTPPGARRAIEIAVSLIGAAILAAAGSEVFSIGLYIRQSGELMEGFPFSSFAMAASLALGLVGQGCAMLIQRSRSGAVPDGRER
jgi:hypothetical protein